jgi:hypothetical protein
MSPRKPSYMDGSEEVINIAQIKETRHGQSLFSSIQKRQDEVDRMIRVAPKISDDDFRVDIRYLLGFQEALRWVAGLPDDARTFIESV